MFRVSLVAEMGFFIAPSAFVSSPIASIHSTRPTRNARHRFGKNGYQSFYALLSHSLLRRSWKGQVPLRGQKNKTNRKGWFCFLVAEMGFEPHDLRVMSPTSYQTAPLRDIGAGSRGRTGTRNKSHGILSPGRLPIPPFRHTRPWIS